LGSHGLSDVHGDEYELVFENGKQTFEIPSKGD
jgi:hypothetical protein